MQKSFLSKQANIITYKHARWFAEAKSEKKEVSWFKRPHSSSGSSGDDKD